MQPWTFFRSVLAAGFLIPLTVSAGAEDASQRAVIWIESAAFDPAATSLAAEAFWSQDELILILSCSRSDSQGMLRLESVHATHRHEVSVSGVNNTRHRVLDPADLAIAEWSSRPAESLPPLSPEASPQIALRLAWVELLALGGRPNPGDRLLLHWQPASAQAQQVELRFSPPIATPPNPSSLVPRGIKSNVKGAPEAPPEYRMVPVATRLQPNWPVQAVAEPGTRNLWVIEEDGPYGRTQIVRLLWDAPSSSSQVPKQILISSPQSESEVAYSIAFHPDYQSNGWVFVGSNGGGEGEPKRSRVARYRVNREPPFEVDPASRRVIIEWPSDGHNGAAVVFGPDRMLYVTSGDGTADSDRNDMGQGTDHLLSKVLRINVDVEDVSSPYTIPPDNPFVDDARFRPETWAYGFRNPWRIAADPRHGRIWVGNNGQDLWEQVYLVERGANYGWSAFEGSHPFHSSRKLGPTPVSKPKFEHHHAEARSLTGGVVYLGRRFPELHGAYLYGDYATGRLWGAMLDDEGNVLWHRLLADGPQKLTAIELDPDGEIVICDHQPSGTPALYTLDRVDAAPFDPLAFPRRLSETGLFASVIDHRPVDGAIPYSVNAPLWSDGAAKSRFVVLPPRSDNDDAPAAIQVSGQASWSFPEGTVLVKSFGIEAADRSVERWIETRVMVLQQGEWAGYTYRWNAEGTDASLVETAGEDQDWPVAHDNSKLAWHYPSRTECLVCHSRAAGFVLGLSMPQIEGRFQPEASLAAMLSADADPVSVEPPDDRLRYFVSLGVLRTAVERDREQLLKRWPTKVDSQESMEAVLDRLLGIAPPVTSGWNPELVSSDVALGQVPITRLPQSKDDALALVDPAAENDVRGEPVPLEWRVRSYLHANCAHCHVEAGGGNARIDLSAFVDLDLMRLIDQPPIHGSPEFLASPSPQEFRLVVPGEPEQSVLWRRVAHRGTGQMPPLSTTKVDPVARELLKDWIESLPPASPKR